MTRLPTFVAALVLGLLSCGWVAASAGPDDHPPGARAAIFDAFARKDFAAADRLIDAWLERDPRDITMLYNSACANAQVGALDEGADRLLDAIKAGYRDFDYLSKDPDLEPLRGHEVYQAIQEAVRRVERRGRRDRGGRFNRPGRTAFDYWRDRYGEEDYIYAKDEEHNLAYAAALDEVSFREMQDMLYKQAEYLLEHFFDGPPEREALVAIPTPRHADELLDRPQVGGLYEPDRRRLIARNIGGSLRHEFFHLMHHAHMRKLDQRHTLWMQEGIASLFEDYTLSDNGRIRFLPNERLNVAQRVVRSGRHPDWNELFTMGSRQFMGRATVHYPLTRTIFRYVAERGKLPQWYATYVDTYHEDPTGRKAFEVAFGRPLEDIERGWRNWLLRQPPVDTVVREGDASLGVEIGIQAANDGVLVTGIFADSGAAAAGLQAGDVLVSIDGIQTRSSAELRTIIASKRVGDRVEVRLRRGRDYVNKQVTLRPLGRQRL